MKTAGEGMCVTSRGGKKAGAGGVICAKCLFQKTFHAGVLANKERGKVAAAAAPGIRDAPERRMRAHCRIGQGQIRMWLGRRRGCAGVG